MLKSSLLDDLLGNFLNEIHELTAALVVDLEGLIIAQQSISGFDEEIIGAIMAVLEKTISKIKRFAETSYGSGTFDTNQYRLFYLELGGSEPALFVLVTDPYSNIDDFIPYSYIVAEKVSLILNNREVSIDLPKLGGNRELELKPCEDSSMGKSIATKIVVIGNDAVGKTTLIDMWAYGKYDEKYLPTIGVSIVEKELQITKRMRVSFFIFDMGGLKSFVKVRRNFYKHSETIMILFDFSRIETLEKVTDWIEEARYFIKDQSVPYILVGNKVDLVENREEIINKAKNIADQHKLELFITSALTGEGLDELFMYLLNFASHLG